MKFYEPFPADISVCRDDIYHRIEQSILALKYETLLNEQKYGNLQAWSLINYNKLPEETTGEKANEWLQKMNDLILLEIMKPITKTR